jgi:hypothetical protein
MPKLANRLAPMDQEGAWQLPRITYGSTHAKADGWQAPYQYLHIQQLLDLGSLKDGSLVKRLRGIAYVSDIRQTELGQKVSTLLLGAHVNHDNGRPVRLNLLPVLGQVGDRLPTEESAKVAQEDQQDRMLLGKFRKTVAALGPGAQLGGAQRAVYRCPFRSLVYSSHGRATPFGAGQSYVASVYLWRRSP